MDPRTLDGHQPEDELRDWDPLAPPLAPTIFKCTRCGHEAHTPAIVA